MTAPNKRFQGVGTVDAVTGEKRLSRREKAARYGKRFKAGYVELNREHLGGDVDPLRRELEREQAWRDDARLQVDIHDPVAVHAARSRAAPARGGAAAALLRAAAPAPVAASLRVPGTAAAAHLRRRRHAERCRADGLRGYVELGTTAGDLRIEVWCAEAPTAAQNFLALCRRGYYTGTRFHRVTGDAAEGGDPTGTGGGGDSIWGGAFEAEAPAPGLAPRAGVLRMVGDGGGGHRSRFAVALSAAAPPAGDAPFGTVAGCADALRRLRDTPVDPATDHPLREVCVTHAKVFWDPFQFLDEEEEGNGDEEGKPDG